MAADLTDVAVPVQLDLNSGSAHALAYANVELRPTTAFLEAHLFAPTTTVVLPSNGATLSASQYLDATASPGLSAVQYELSGQGLTNAVIATGTPTLYGWLAAWNTTGVPNGTYTLHSVATYQGGVAAQGGVTATSAGSASPSTTLRRPRACSSHRTRQHCPEPPPPWTLLPPMPPASSSGSSVAPMITPVT